MKRKYIKPETKKFTAEPLELLTGTNITENGTVDTAAGEGEDEEEALTYLIDYINNGLGE